MNRFYASSSFHYLRRRDVVQCDFSIDQVSDEVNNKVNRRRLPDLGEPQNEISTVLPHGPRLAGPLLTPLQVIAFIESVTVTSSSLILGNPSLRIDNHLDYLSQSLF